MDQHMRLIHDFDEYDEKKRVDQAFRKTEKATEGMRKNHDHGEFVSKAIQSGAYVV